MTLRPRKRVYRTMIWFNDRGFQLRFVLFIQENDQEQEANVSYRYGEIRRTISDIDMSLVCL